MVYARISVLIPRIIVEWFRKQLTFVGIDVEEKRFVGFLLSFGLALSLAISLNLFVFMKIQMLLSFPLIFVLFLGGIIFWLNSVSQSKANFVEKILPDALQLIASNIKAGLTTEKALFVSARIEFGPFSEELKRVSKRIFAGERVDVALMGLPKKIKSQILERTIWLLVQGMKSGGEIANLLIKLGDDLREENAIREEIKANVTMYLLLIFVSAAFGAPLLFGISSYIVGVISEQMGSLQMSEEQVAKYAGQSPVGRLFGVPSTKITEEFVTFFAEVTLFVTCIFAGLTLGAINTGKETDGIKFIPLLLIVSFAIFFLVRSLMGQLFGSVFTML